MTAEERQEASKNGEEARVWISGLEVVKKKLGIRQVVDLSATPFFLRGSGYREGTLFPWTVSDFSFIEIILPRICTLEKRTLHYCIPPFRGAGMKNITLSADEALIESARQRAAKEHTTLNEQFQRWLADYVGRQRQAERAMAAIDAVAEVIDTGGRKFTREEMNER